MKPTVALYGLALFSGALALVAPSDVNGIQARGDTMHTAYGKRSGNDVDEKRKKSYYDRRGNDVDEKRKKSYYDRRVNDVDEKRKQSYYV